MPLGLSDTDQVSARSGRLSSRYSAYGFSFGAFSVTVWGRRRGAAVRLDVVEPHLCRQTLHADEQLECVACELDADRLRSSGRK